MKIFLPLLAAATITSLALTPLFPAVAEKLGPSNGAEATPALGVHESRIPDAGFVTGDGYLSHPMILRGNRAAKKDFSAGVSYPTVTSGNWAGVAQSDNSHNFTSVGAIFNIPTSVVCNSTSNLVAEWVGLNGYSSSSVEQTGVAISCATGSPTFQAWYEMYPALPVYISTATYPVSPGDIIIGGVSNNNGSYTMAIWNYTKNWSFSTTQQSSQVTATSAEAIVEVPNGATNPNYGSIPFGAAGGNVIPGGNGVVFRQPQAGDAPIYTINTINSSGAYRSVSTGLQYGNQFSPNMQVNYVNP